jgi:hypothetical protein
MPGGAVSTSGILMAPVDFNHMVGPRIEFSRGTICDDDEVAKLLPFLAHPDGAHLVHSPRAALPAQPLTPRRAPKTTRTFTSSLRRPARGSCSGWHATGRSGRPRSRCAGRT